MLKPFRCHKNCQCWCLVIIVLGYANLVLINLLTSDNFFCVNQFYFGSYHSLVKCLKEKETKEDIIRAESTTLPLIKGVVSPHNFSLDAVITYVNGSDPYFAAELRNAEMTRLNETKLPFSASSNRFSDNSDLLFLLRSLEKFGDIFRYIWLVVAFETQIPQWLNISHPKLKLVYHSDIWYDKSHLPVFNSLAVEANLHHIPNLSDIFVYFNDDLAVTKLLSLEDFIFNGNDRRIVIRPDFQLKIPPRWAMVFSAKKSPLFRLGFVSPAVDPLPDINHTLNN